MSHTVYFLSTAGCVKYYITIMIYFSSPFVYYFKCRCKVNNNLKYGIAWRLDGKIAAKLWILIKPCQEITFKFQWGIF